MFTKAEKDTLTAALAMYLQSGYCGSYSMEHSDTGQKFERRRALKLLQDISAVPTLPEDRDEKTEGRPQDRAPWLHAVDWAVPGSDKTSFHRVQPGGVDRGGEVDSMLRKLGFRVVSLNEMMHGLETGHPLRATECDPVEVSAIDRMRKDADTVAHLAQELAEFVGKLADQE